MVSFKNGCQNSMGKKYNKIGLFIIDTLRKTFLIW